MVKWNIHLLIHITSVSIFHLGRLFFWILKHLKIYICILGQILTYSFYISQLFRWNYEQFIWQGITKRSDLMIVNWHLLSADSHLDTDWKFKILVFFLLFESDFLFQSCNVFRTKWSLPVKSLSHCDFLQRLSKIFNIISFLVAWHYWLFC